MDSLFRPFYDVPPENTVEGFTLKQEMKRDIRFQLLLRKIERDREFLLFESGLGGSGLYMSKLLRTYFAELDYRFMQCGPKGFPSSFNILEAFFNFDHLPAPFALRKELEYLLKLEDFLSWSKDQSDTTCLLEAALKMEDGVIHSFDFLPNAQSLDASKSKEMVVAGVSLVRHGTEVSLVFLVGENPPIDVTDTKIKPDYMTPGKEKLQPDPDLTKEDRFLEGYAEHGKILLLTRVDLASKTYDVRYLLKDLGNSYAIFTDDHDGFGDFPKEHKERVLEGSKKLFEDYSELFSLLLTMVKLPSYLHSRQDDIQELEMMTGYGSEKPKPSLRKKLKDWKKEIEQKRVIRGLTIWEDEDVPGIEINPPELIFETKGFWKPISAGQLGVDKDGKKVAGKTWVTRKESWEAPSLESFFLQRRTRCIEGPNPGFVYIMRSPAHELDVYKIGLTTKSPEERAKQLNKTSTPLPLEVLASWQVGDCKAVEAEIHKRLDDYRINPRREFFGGPIQHFMSVSWDVCRSLNVGH